MLKHRIQTTRCLTASTDLDVLIFIFKSKYLEKNQYEKLYDFHKDMSECSIRFYQNFFPFYTVNCK